MVTSQKRKSRRKSKARRNCKYGQLKRPVRNKETGRMRYCKLKRKSKRKSNSKRKSRKSKRKSKRKPNRKSRRKSMRKSKMKPKRKSRRKSKRKSKRKPKRKSRGTSVCGLKKDVEDYDEVILNSKWKLTSEFLCGEDEDVSEEHVNQVLKVELPNKEIFEYKAPKNIQDNFLSKIVRKTNNPLVPLELSKYDSNSTTAKEFEDMFGKVARPVFLLELDTQTMTKLPKKLVLKAGEDYEIYKEISDKAPECIKGLIPVAKVEHIIDNNCPRVAEKLDRFGLTNNNFNIPLSVTKQYDYDLQQFAETKVVTMSDLIKHIVNIGEILLCLQNKDVYYPDLKLENIFVCDYGKNSQVWLGDIEGLCHSELHCITTFPAPEILDEIFTGNHEFNSRNYNMNKVMAWQFGVLLLETLFAKDKNNTNVLFVIFSNNYVRARYDYVKTRNPSLSSDAIAVRVFDKFKISNTGENLSIDKLYGVVEKQSPDIVKIIRRLLKINPTERITIQKGVEELKRSQESLLDNIPISLTTRTGKKHEFNVPKYTTVKSLTDMLLKNKEIPEFTKGQTRLVAGGRQLSPYSKLTDYYGIGIGKPGRIYHVN